MNAAALTQTGMSLGTPTYMSPEQAFAEKDIDGRSDQYSLACVGGRRGNCGRSRT